MRKKILSCHGCDLTMRLNAKPTKMSSKKKDFICQNPIIKKFFSAATNKSSKKKTVLPKLL
jgi:hypothetical protein